MINIWTAERSHLSTSHISISPFSEFSDCLELFRGVSCAMSCLTSFLQLLQVLTALSGCNIYRYVEGRRVFRLNQKINFLVGAMHRFWLRPWLLFIFLMHVINWGLEFLRGLTDLNPGSERPLNLIYRMGSTVAKNQNFFISMGLAYHYKYSVIFNFILST